MGAKGRSLGVLGPPRAFLSLGGALYQPVTMVTSQGQVLAQAIAPGALQLPNAQVRPSPLTFPLYTAFCTAAASVKPVSQGVKLVGVS